MTIATTTDVADALQRQLTGAEKVAVTAILEAVESDITAEIGPRFETAAQTALIPGTWSRDLELPDVNIASITSVALNGTTIATSAYIWNERTLLRNGVSTLADLGESDIVSDWDTDGLQGAGWQAGAHWGGPASTVTVVYTPTGVVPAWVKQLAVRAAIRSLGQPTGGVASESLGAYSVTYADGVATATGELTGAERELLRRRFRRSTGTIRMGV